MKESTRVYQDELGLWHWIYSLPMFSNLSVLRTVLKAMAICCLLPVVTMLVIIYSNGSTLSGSFEEFGLTLAIAGGIFLLSIVIYFLVSVFYGGNYVFIYTMDDHSITTTQPADQAAKLSAIGMFTAASGAVSHNPGIMIAGLAAGGSQIAHTAFEDIKTLTFDRKNEEIRIHSFLTWYSIYVNSEDFPLVAEFIRARSTRADIKEL